LKNAGTRKRPDTYLRPVPFSLSRGTENKQKKLGGDGEQGVAVKKSEMMDEKARIVENSPRKPRPKILPLPDKEVKTEEIAVIEPEIIPAEDEEEAYDEEAKVKEQVREAMMALREAMGESERATASMGDL